MLKILRAASALTLAATLLLVPATPALGAPGAYDDFDAITSHVDLAVPQTLAICNPPQDLTVNTENYYLTGTSDPDQPLRLNGDQVPGRGIYGSWGVYVPLYEGKNEFTIQQGQDTHTVTITRQPAGTVATTDSLQSLYPSDDSPYRTGDQLTFSCTAPSGAVVWASFGEVKVELAQEGSAEPGAPVRFQGSTLVGGVIEPVKAGPIQYGMTWKDSTKTLDSQGSLYLYPQDSLMPVQITDTYTTVYKDSAAKAVSTVVKGGAVDSVADQTDDMLLLGMGSWIPKSSATLLLTGATQNLVSGVSFSKTNYGERIKLTGTVNPITTSQQADNTLTVELHHTSGVGEVPLAESKLFSGVVVTTDGDSTILEFTLAAGQALWGHTVEYADNVTTLYCKYPPVRIGGDQKPLSDLVVGLDAGHGGSDPGALGTARLTGPVEKDITYATALAVQKRLESLGAKVIMTAYTDTGKITPSARQQAATEGKADFYLSLHCNSVAGNGLKAKGVEIYYYYNRSKPFADRLLEEIVAETGRQKRSVMSNNFRVTMNSLTPAVLIEMGFLSNPEEYDQMCSKDGIFRTANAIGDSLVGMIS